jgi:type II secretory pathway pseudopilin PulG
MPMILRRMSESLRAQNWTNVAIELAIVIVGVFIGIQAANWNQQRQERNETRLLLSQIQVELTAFSNYLGGVHKYYETTAKYADRADAAWNGDPSVSDEEFVIAAYQASQITAVGNNSAVWAEIFGAGDLRNIKDLDVRRSLSQVMTFDYDTVSLASVASKYREEVRKVIPDNIQSAIRKRCGDRRLPGQNAAFGLPATCDLGLPGEEAAAVAADLRSRPELQGELRWHRAAVANQILNIESLELLSRGLTKRIRHL